METPVCLHMHRYSKFSDFTAGDFTSENVVEFDPKYGTILGGSQGSLLTMCSACGAVLERAPLTLNV